MGRRSPSNKDTLPPQVVVEPATANGHSESTGEGFELLISTESALATVRLEPGKRYVIGRGKDNDIVVEDASVPGGTRGRW